VVVIGTSAAGKSTLAAALARALQVPHVELDPLYWGPDWTPKPQAEFLRLIDAVTTGPGWVADGNYGSARHHLWPRANLVVWLNYSLPVVLWRGLRRTVARAVSGRALWHGNRESWRRAFFSRQSILWWILTTHGRRTRELAALRDAGAHGMAWVELRHPAEAQAWLDGLATARAPDRTTQSVK
jgi:adenylate kinase family enzyme